MFKRKRRNRVMAGQVTDTAANRIAAAIHTMQNGFAKWMNKQTKNFSSRTWKWLVVVFALGWSVLNVYIFSNTFMKQPAAHQRNQPPFIKKPLYTDSLVLMEQIYQQHIKPTK